LSALAVGAAEKGVIAFYEKSRRPDDKVWDEWIEKNSSQVLGGLGAIEQAAPEDGGWLADREITQADITTAVAIEFINVVMPDLIDDKAFPRLNNIVTRLNKRKKFSSTHPSTE